MNARVRGSLLIVLFIFTTTMLAEGAGVILPETLEGTRDVVYLKNGSIIRGEIREMIPDSTIRIQTGDGNMFVFAMADVEKIVKEDVPPPQVTSSGPAPAPVMTSVDDEKVRVALFAGAGIPVGDFAKTEATTEAGFAKTGIMLGGELEAPLNSANSFVATLTVAFNSLDFPSGPGIDVGQWVTIWPMAGIRLSTPGDQQFRLHGTLQGGLLIGTYPDISITGSGGSYLEPSSTAVAVAFSFGIGVTVVNRLVLDARFMYGAPEYSLTATSNGTTASGTLKQSTMLIRIGAGIILN